MKPKVNDWSRGAEWQGRPADATASAWPAFVAAVPHPLVVLALDGSVRLWNRPAAELLGWPAAPAGRQPTLARREPPWFRRVRAAILDGAPHVTASLRRGGERVRRVRLVLSPIYDGAGHVEALLAAVHDTTRVWTLEQELAEGERRYRDLLELSPEAIAIHDHDRILYVNPAAIDLIGAERPDQIVGRPLLDFVPAELHPVVAERRELLESGARFASLSEQKVIRLDGQTIDVEVVAIPIRFRRGGAVQVIIRDVSARKRAEAGLRASQERFRLLTENVRDYAIVMLDADGHIVSWNSGAERLTGFRADEATRVPFTALFGEDGGDDGGAATRGPSILDRAAVHGRCEEDGWRLRKDGTRFWASVAVTALFDPDRTVVGYAAIVRDLTERREAEAALRRSEDHLRQAQKMEGIGRLAGGIAHDFNNLLTAIQGHAQFLLEDLEQGSSPYGDAEEIKRAADRASALTRQLLAFSRKQVLQPQLLDVNHVIREMQKLLRRVIREDIEVFTTLDPEVHPVLADAGQLEQVVMNLAVNARDAMPGGGSFTIQTANVRVDRTTGSAGLVVAPGEYVQLSVSDTGVGMDRETQAKIFEPFFTTKPEGQGTGLGLATVYGIVKQWNGTISVYSEPGRGTTFRILAPRGSAAGERRAPAASEMAHGWEAVLLVEDDTALRGLASKTLQDRGYSVLESGSAEEALRLAAEYDGPIDLVLTDIILPDMSGRRLADSIRSLHPGTKLLFMSGFTASDVVRQGLIDADAAFIEKPYGPEKLAGKVREVLDTT
jgi:two-component system, cell cycle sensor histidine kinase and response regulator CckA